MYISIPYGRTHLTAELPEERVQAVLKSHLESYVPPMGQTELVEAALHSPIGSETLEKLAAVLTGRSEAYGHTIYIISDEPYREIVFEGSTVHWIPHIYKDTIICYSFSKALSVPGERLGYVLVPKDIADSAAVYAAVARASRSMGHVNAPSLFQQVIR